MTQSASVAIIGNGDSIGIGNGGERNFREVRRGSLRIREHSIRILRFWMIRFAAFETCFKWRASSVVGGNMMPMQKAQLSTVILLGELNWVYN